MTVAIRYVVASGVLDGVTDVSESATYSLDPAGDGTILAEVAGDLGIINPVVALRDIQRPINAGGLGNQIVKKSAAVQRGFGVALDDFLVAGGVIRYTAVPAASPSVELADRGTTLRPFTVDVSTGAPEEFIFGCDLGAEEPALVLTGQSLNFLQVAMAPAQALEVLLYLVPVDNPDGYIQFCRAVGPPGPPGIFVQEPIAAEAAVVDTILAAELSSPPFSAASVALYRDRAFLKQGAGFDYELVGPTLQQINWLAGTGTAPALAAPDVLVAMYNA